MFRMTAQPFDRMTRRSYWHAEQFPSWHAHTNLELVIVEFDSMLADDRYILNVQHDPIRPIQNYRSVVRFKDQILIGREQDFFAVQFNALGTTEHHFTLCTVQT